MARPLHLPVLLCCLLLAPPALADPGAPGQDDGTCLLDCDITDDLGWIVQDGVRPDCRRPHPRLRGLPPHGGGDRCPPGLRGPRDEDTGSDEPEDAADPVTGGEPEYWDPRLSDPDLNPPVMASFEPADVSAGETYLHVTRVEYQSEQESGGNHHVFAYAPEGVQVYAMDYNGVVLPLEQKTENGVTWFELAMWGGNVYSIYAQGEDGTRYEGMATDTVHGLLMPSNHHVNFVITFEAAASTNDPALGAE